MIIREVRQDLFTVDESYHLAHCISADFALGAGIAKEFEKRFHIRQELFSMFPEGLGEYMKKNCILGQCIPTNNYRVFNLVTKNKYYDKPTYASLSAALRMMRSSIKVLNINKIAIPTIGCGLDRLNWDDVRALINFLYQDTDVEFLVCFKP